MPTIWAQIFRFPAHCSHTAPGKVLREREKRARRGAKGRGGEGWKGTVDGSKGAQGKRTEVPEGTGGGIVTRCSGNMKGGKKGLCGGIHLTRKMPTAEYDFHKPKNPN